MENSLKQGVVFWPFAIYKALYFSEGLTLYRSRRLSMKQNRRTVEASDIKAYHAHLYYRDESGLELAKQVAQQVSNLFEVQVGRFHRQPVGPHPLWSCQLSFAVKTFTDLIPWLMLNRQSLDVFVHPVTGDDYFDHTQGVIWLGHAHKLDISQFDAS